ncbi:DUF1107 family protein [Vibrio sp. S11_S32]|nr:DUF1107 family protein [Vibrio sp. S11_S32]
MAKHISRLFKGYIEIDGMGKFEFDNAKLMVPAQPENKHYQTVKEINLAINRIRTFAM